MKIKLIPVLEIFHSSNDISMPSNSPCWLYPEEWQEYKRSCLLANGFSDMTSYLKGSSFYQFSEINNHNLLLQIKYRTEGWKLDEICPFDGGYVLNVDGKDLLFPQCCSDLGDIANWFLLAEGDRYGLWEGHPWPIITVEKDIIRFDLTVAEFDEYFEPTPLEEIFTIDRLALKDAVNNLMNEIEQFSERLNIINTKKSLGFEGLDEILIGRYK